MAPTNAPLDPNRPMTLADVTALLAQQQQAHMETMSKLVEQITEPQRRKDEEERQKQVRRAENAARQATLDHQSRTAAQANCSHLKRDKSPSWGGQVNSDGYVRPMCTQCFKVMPEIKAPVEWIQGGVNFQDKEIFPILTEEMLLSWHRVYGPKPKAPRVIPQVAATITPAMSGA